MLKEPTSERQFIMYEALRKGATTEALFAAPTSSPGSSSRCASWCSWKRKSWHIVARGRRGRRHRSVLPYELLVRAKKDGFADALPGKLLGVPEARVPPSDSPSGSATATARSR